MSYETISPPFTLDFPNMSKKELKEYFVWFHGIIPRRLEVLLAAVHETDEFSDWKPDLSPESLNRLGEWFASQVQVRSRTAEEMAEMEKGSLHPITIPNRELTNRTFSVAFDIGIYLSQVLLKSIPSLKWEQPRKSKNFVDYGQPVLSGGRTFNPVRMMVTQAYGLADGKRLPEDLRKIHDIWIQLLLPK